MLRSEHIELNVHNNVIFGDCDPNCDECEVFETVRHFLIDCNKYIEQRKELRKKLIEVDRVFKSNKNFNAKRILFYHKYQPNRNSDIALDNRIKILKYICSYVHETRRFKREDVRSNVFRMYDMDRKYNIHKDYKRIYDEINNLDKKDILQMAQERDESFNIKNEVIGDGEELDDNYID